MHDTMGDVGVSCLYYASGSDLDPISVSRLQLCVKFSDYVLFWVGHCIMEFKHCVNDCVHFHDYVSVMRSVI